MAHYILRSGANRLLKSGNIILTSSDEPKPPIVDYDSRIFAGLADGTPINRWPDQSGNKIDLLQPNPDYQLKYYSNPGGPSYLRAVGHDGSAEGMQFLTDIGGGTIHILYRNHQIFPEYLRPLFIINALNGNERIYYYGDNGGNVIYPDSLSFYGDARNKLYVNGIVPASVRTTAQSPNFRLLTFDTFCPYALVTLLGAGNQGTCQSADIAALRIFSHRQTTEDRIFTINHILTSFNL